MPSKASIAALSTGVIVTALLAGATTSATWRDSTNLPTTSTISSGDLGLTPLGTMQWTDLTDGAAKPIANIATFVTVPNDKLEGTQGVDLKLVGDNAMGTFSVQVPTASGSLLYSPTLPSGGATPSGVLLTYDVLDKAGNPLASNVPVGQTTGPLSIKRANLTSATGAYDSQADLTFRLKASFAQETPDREDVLSQVALAKSSITLQQVR